MAPHERILLSRVDLANLAIVFGRLGALGKEFSLNRAYEFCTATIRAAKLIQSKDSMTLDANAIELGKRGRQFIGIGILGLKRAGPLSRIFV